jgi:hypothetical protein
MPTDVGRPRARLTAAVATGSNNDYAAYLAAGTVVVCVALAMVTG